VLLHLHDYQQRGAQYASPDELTQDGIANAVRASQNFISVVMRQMVAEGLVEEKINHVQGRGRRMKVYELSQLGFQHATMIESELRQRKIIVPRGGTVLETSVDQLLRESKPRITISVLVCRPGITEATYSSGGREASPAQARPQKRGSETGGKGFDIMKKVCVLGDVAVGKTSLIRRFVVDQFDDKYIRTIGTKVTTKEVLVERPSGHGGIGTATVKLMIWDLLGQPGYENIRASAFLGSKGAFVVCDQTRDETLDSVLGWVQKFNDACPGASVMLLVNKHDLVDDAAFSDIEVKEVSGMLGIPYFYTSARTGENIEGAFAAIVNDMLKLSNNYHGTGGKDSQSSIVALLDRIIDRYCDSHGGQGMAMPVIEKAALESSLDIGAPSVDALRKFIILLGVDESCIKELDSCHY
jgi:small GTP-binding protein